MGLPTPIERGIESVINNRYSFDIGLEARRRAPCTARLRKTRNKTPYSAQHLKPR